MLSSKQGFPNDFDSLFIFCGVGIYIYIAGFHIQLDTTLGKVEITWLTGANAVVYVSINRITEDKWFTNKGGGIDT